MPTRTLLTVLFVMSACGSDGGRGGTDGAASLTGATAGGSMSAGGALTEATDAEPATGGAEAPDSGSSAPPDGTTEMVEPPGGTTEASTLDSESFPQTSISSLASSDDGFGETLEPQCEQVLDAMVRDFKEEHVDFESDDSGTDPGIVLADLGPDNKPVYAGQDGNPTTHGKDAFDQWYRDVADVNIPIARQIELTDDGNGRFIYDNSTFFPIDDQGWGNQGNSHNYHFTLEMHTVFSYKGGEVFKFRGDDDLFVFINKKLAMDLGGVHGPQEVEVDLDANAAALGIVPGGNYALDFFFAERHTSESNFRIETTISCLVVPG